MRRETVKTLSGELYVRDNDGQGWTLVAQAHNIQIGMNPDVHRIVKRACKYLHGGYDENKQFVMTCRHPKNTPRGCSWGDCHPMVCPLAWEVTP